MGGFVLQDPHEESDDSYLPAWQSSGVLTPDGVRFLMEHEPALVPDLPLHDIMERSKADSLAKALLIWQILWFCLSCINRATHHLPLSLLEVSTIAHAVCALLTYVAWWKKPKDIGQPTVITGDGARELGAWMSMASSAERFVVGGMISFSHRSELEHLDIVHEARPDASGEEIPTVSFRPHILSHDHSRKPPWVRRTMWNPRDALPYVWRTRYLFHMKALPWYAYGSSDAAIEQHATALRWTLASQACRKYCLSPPSHLPSHPVAFVTPVAHLQASSSSRHEQLPDSNVKGFRLRRTLIAVVLTTVYGTPHLIGWDAAFATPIEQRLWRAASIIVMAIGGTMLVLVFVGSNVFDVILGAVTADRWMTRVMRRLSMVVGRILVLSGGILYILASAYLVLESFKQLFALPSQAFVLPSWSDYLPHF